VKKNKIREKRHDSSGTRKENLKIFDFVFSLNFATAFFIIATLAFALMNLERSSKY